MFAAFALLVVLLAKVIAVWCREIYMKKSFAEQREGLNSQVLTIDETGIGCDLRGGEATSHHTWRTFVRRIDMPDSFLFLPSTQTFVRVPKLHLSPEELKQIQQWSSNVPSDAK